MTNYSNLTSKDTVFSYFCTTCNTNLRSEYCVFFNNNVVSNLHKVINFSSSLNAGNIKRCPINGRI